MIPLILSACGTGESAATSTSIPTDTPIVPPAATATPTVPLAVLVVPADLDPDTSNLYQKTVYDLAQASGFRFQVLNSLTPETIEPACSLLLRFRLTPVLPRWPPPRLKCNSLRSISPA